MKRNPTGSLRGAPAGTLPGTDSGFSLVEVTIAMAIAAVSLITLIGLLPQGMGTMRDAGDRAIEGRIHQQILNELQMTDFDSLETYDGMEVFYDNQGEELGDSEGGGDSGAKGSFEHIYTAKISIPSPSGGKVPDSVGGSSFSGIKFDNGDPNENLRLAIVEVAAVAGRGADFKWDDEENRPIIHTYQSFVTKMGRDFKP